MEENKNLEILCKYLYGIYALTMLLQMLPETMLTGTIAMLIAVIITYAKQGAAKGTILESHFKWMLRNFWIGAGVYLPLLTLAGFGIVYYSIDFTKLTEAVYSGEVADSEQMMDILMKDYGPLLITTLVVTMGPFMLWWFWRCWKGYKALKDGKAVDNVMSWV